jgi:hypothetical protein
MRAFFSLVTVATSVYEPFEGNEEPGEELGLRVSGKRCKGMAGLWRRKRGYRRGRDEGVRDLALISGAQRVEHRARIRPSFAANSRTDAFIGQRPPMRFCCALPT